MVDVVGLRFVNEGLNESLQGLQQHSRAVDRATQSMKVAANQSNENAKSLDRLNRDVLRAENEMRRLAQAMQRGAVTGAQFQGEVNRIAARLRNLGLDRAQAETMKFARAQADLARETQQAGNAIVRQSAQVQTAMRGQAAETMFASRAQNANGMVMQQVGYQVGDFLVQVQSGTNALVAFGQQATQLVGVLPMMGSFMGLSGTALIGLSAGLGIAIPLVTALGAAFMRTSGTGRTLAQDVNVLSSTVADYRTQAELARKSAADLAESFGSQAQSIQRLSAALQEAIRLQALDEINRTLDRLGDTVSVGLLDSLRGFTNDATGQLRKLQHEFDLSEQQAYMLATAFQGFRDAEGIEGAVNAAESLHAILLQVFGSAQAIPPELRNAYVQAGLLAQTAAEMEGSFSDTEDRIRSASGLADAFRSIMESISIDSLLSQMDTLNSQLGSAIFGAGTLTARLRGVFEAGVAAAERAAYAQEIGGGRSMGRGGPTAEEIQNYDPRAQIAYTPGGTAGVPLPRIPGRRGGGGGGGGGAVREQEDYLKNLLLEAEQKRKLVGLTEDETRRQEILFELKKRELPLNDARIEQIIETEAQTRLLMEAEEKRQQLMQTVEGHIENAFMSWVDGSQSVEDAFKGMLRNILLAIYQQQVAEPAARAVGGLLAKAIPFLFKADGGAFNKGVEFFANGGVVGSPTMFQHSGGLGVMGEAGPEAIMPLKRGANGKLGVQMEGGSEQPVVVNQYFQLSANGDDSVRRIVRQEAPRMAEMAKSAVVDAKRRGGSYGRSF